MPHRTRSRRWVDTWPHLGILIQLLDGSDHSALGRMVLNHVKRKRI